MAGLVSYFDIGNGSCYAGSGTTVYDLSGNNRTLTISPSNGFTYENLNGGAIKMLGGYQTEMDGATGLATGTVAYTIELWQRCHNLFNTACLYTLGETGDYAPRGFCYSDGSLNQACSGIANSSPGTTYCPVNTWIQIVQSHPAGGTATNYGNGVQWSTTGGGLSLGTSSTIGWGRWGGGVSGARSYFAIGRVYDRALTGAEVLANFGFDRDRFDL